MARTHNSSGTHSDLPLNSRPLRQAIILVECNEHEDHTILISGWRTDEVDSTSDFIASAMQQQGYTVHVQSATSHNALYDVNMRHPGFDDTLSWIKTSAALGRSIPVPRRDRGEELPF